MVSVYLKAGVPEYVQKIGGVITKDFFADAGVLRLSRYLVRTQIVLVGN